MTYWLGVDLGTTYTAAATLEGDRAEIFELGTRSATVPSVVFITDDLVVLAGEAAQRRALRQPSRVAREFKRRVGDPTPLLIGGSPYPAESLSAMLLKWVLDTVSSRQGGAPAGIVLTHPANWGAYRLDLLRQSLRMAGVDHVDLVSEPEAAAIQYASLERVDPGSIVAVFDLGGGTFDAAVLRKAEPDGFEFLGPPEGIERLGGVDFDEAVFGFVKRWVPGSFEDLDPDDPATLAAVARLRDECIEAKEALSFDTKVSIPVALPGVHTDVTLTRAEFEDLIRPSLVHAIQAMQRVVVGAGIVMAEVDTILLVGGSSRIPLIGEMVAGQLGRPVAVDAHPKHLVALGAARAGSLRTRIPVPPTVSDHETPESTSPDPPEALNQISPPQQVETDQPRSVQPSPMPRRSPRVLVGALLAAAATALVAALVLWPRSNVDLETEAGNAQAATTPTSDTLSTTETTLAAATSAPEASDTTATGSPGPTVTELMLSPSTTSPPSTTATTERAPAAQTTRPTSPPSTEPRSTTTAPSTTTSSTTTSSTTTSSTTTTSTTTTSTTTTTTQPPTTLPAATQVPSVSGLTGQQAVQRLQASGLSSGCGDRCADIVVGTSPAVGTELEPGTFVSLLF